MRKRLTKQLYYGSDTIPDPETGELVAAPPPVAVNDGSDKWDLNGLVRGELYINDYAKDPALFILGSDNLVKRIGGTGTGGGSGVISVDIDILAGDGIDIGKKMVGEDLIFTVSHADTSSVESTSNRDIFLIQNLEFDDFGHVTGVNNVNAAKLFDDRYLRKDINDTAHGIITFDKDIRSTVFLDGYDGKGWEIKNNGSVWLESANIRTNAFINNHVGSPNFTSGFLNGIGWDLAPYKRFNAAEIEETKYRLELDDLIVRGKLRVFEMIISQQRGENDNVIFAGMMKVAFYDEATKRIYLDTDKGLLYNPFRTGDILMVQRFGGMPSVGNKYNVIKQYELQVTEAGIGSLTDGENRLDWVKFSNFVGKLSDIQVGDVLTRVDSVSDSTRKGIVKITTIDEIGSPYIDCVYGLKTDPVNATKARMGDLSGIRTKNNVDLTGVVGFYAQGAVLENSYIYLDNGMTVEQNFTVMNGKFESQIEGLKNDMSLEAGNILRNSSFSNNTNYWIADNVVHFINVDGKFLWMDGSFYVEKNAVADIYRDGNKNVLRILNTTIRQYNDVMTGDKPEGTYSFTFFAKVLRAGTLTAGFSGKDLFVQQQMTTSDSYQKISKAANWDGQGDFSIGFTGEILIYGVSLFNDALSDAVIKLQTQITQNAEEIKLSATKDYVDSETEQIYIHYDSQLSVTAEQISGISTKIDNINNTINTAGWITRNDAVSLFATKTQLNGLSSSVADLSVRYDQISSAVGTNTQGIKDAKDLANKAYECGVYSQEQYSQTSNPWNSWASGQEFKHVGALWYNPSTKQTKRYTGIDGSNSWETVNDSAVTAASFVLQNKDKWQLVVANFDANGKPTEESGLLTTAYGNTLYAKKDGIISAINQSPESISINASKINLNGVVTANNTFKIDTSGFMTATGGKIASFNIGNDSLTISKNNIYSGFGISTGPGVLGVDVPLWIKNSSVASLCVAAYFEASGSTNQFNNIAISTKGAFEGLALKTRQTSSSVTLTNSDVFVSCYNQSSITINLPSSPVTGKLIYIKNINGYDITVNGNGKSIAANANSSSISSSTRGEVMMFVYDGQYWAAAYIKW